MLLHLSQVLIHSPLDLLGSILFVLVFPIYHAAYPLLMRIFSSRAFKAHIDPLRRSWVEGLVERKDVLAAAQQTRNLTMVNSLMASSALLLMGVCANLLIRLPESSEGYIVAASWADNPSAVAAKLFLLMIVFGVAFAYCMTSLRHLGHFNLVIGADIEVIREHQGDPVDYLAGLVNRASNRHTLAVRTLYSASPLLFWIFDTPTFVLLNVAWGFKFMGLQDFVRPRGLRAKAQRDARHEDLSDE